MSERKKNVKAQEVINTWVKLNLKQTDNIIFNGVKYIESKYKTEITCQENGKLKCSVGLILSWQ